MLNFNYFSKNQVTVCDLFAHFWTKDIKRHRKDLQAHKGYEKKFRKEDPMATKLISAVPAEVSPEEDVNLDGTFLQSLFDRVTHDEDIINIRQWVPMPGSTIVPDHSYRRVSHPSPPQPHPSQPRMRLPALREAPSRLPSNSVYSPTVQTKVNRFWRNPNDNLVDRRAHGRMVPLGFLLLVTELLSTMVQN